jgi:uncharacterized membrane protein
MWRSRKTTAFFTGLDRGAIVDAIKRAEAKSFGEIRVHLHHGKVADARTAAEKTFLRLGMEKTRHGSGCLVFIAPDSRVFAVIGGSGIHEKVGTPFWTEARDAAQHLFAEGRFTEGVVSAVDRLGEALCRYFPKRGEADTNELPDDVSED